MERNNEEIVKIKKEKEFKNKFLTT